MHNIYFSFSFFFVCRVQGVLSLDNSAEISVIFHFLLRICVSFVLFILTFPLYSPYLFCRIVFCVLFLLYGWSCSLETGPRSCLEGWNGNEWRQVIKIREGSSEICRIRSAECGLP